MPPRLLLLCDFGRWFVWSLVVCIVWYCYAILVVGGGAYRLVLLFKRDDVISTGRHGNRPPTLAFWRRYLRRLLFDLRHDLHGTAWKPSPTFLF